MPLTCRDDRQCRALTGLSQEKRFELESTQLTDEQKEENRMVSKIRMAVENAICGIKRYNILTHPFRNHKPNGDDDVIAISAGLWNFLLASTPSTI